MINLYDLQMVLVPGYLNIRCKKAVHSYDNGVFVFQTRTGFGIYKKRCDILDLMETRLGFGHFITKKS